MKTIYCDNAATSQTRPEVIEAMLPVFAEDFGNPSSLHKYGRKAKTLLESAQQTIAKLINCQANEIIFTSGGTESNNLALIGSARAAQKRSPHKKHLISTVIEHSSVYGPLKKLEEEGWQVTWLKVNQEGFINLEELSQAIRAETLLVSIIHANNEIGTIQDLRAISKICQEAGVLLHVDAVQSAGKVPIDVQETKLDFLSVSGHKIYGPKGIGFLYKRDGRELEPLLCGGSQQTGLKPGTENLPGIIGLSKAIELRLIELEPESARLRRLQSQLIAELSEVPGIRLNGPKDILKRVPGNVNFSVENVSGDLLVLHCDLKGICASSGSACSEGSIEPSPVITALYPHEPQLAYNSLRLSLGLFNTEAEVAYLISTLKNIVNQLRAKRI